MLRFLSIRNLAVIEAIDLEFEPGLNVLTGETGAGKSIVVGAVGLLLGARASADLVRTGEGLASIQAVFEPADGRERIVRREITAQGRSRAFVDGALVTAGALKELTDGLVDLHGQHEHQALLDPVSHLDLLDQYAGLMELRQTVAAAFGEWRSLRDRLERLRMSEREKAARLDLLRFQLAEIDRATPRAGEDEQLAIQRQVLANAEKLQRLCHEGYSLLYESDAAVLAGLGAVWRRVGELASVDAHFAPYLDSRDEIKSQLEDLATFLRSYGEGLDASPARLQAVEDRLALLERLKRKYGPTLEDLLARYAQMKAELAELEGAGGRAADLEGALVEATAAYLDRARSLARSRRAAAADFSRRLVAELADLAMDRTRFEVRFTDGEADESRWSDRGLGEAEFYVSPNPGEDLRPLARIVSGGELSRIMLALKTLATTDSPGKTLIFDEVDAGIGGGVADAVGERLAKLDRQYQVLCVTHLPQIAAYGRAHFLIAKRVRGGRTITRVQRLDAEERVNELARMMGGTKVREGARAAAAEMLRTRPG